MSQRTAFLGKLLGLFCAALGAVGALVAEPGALLVLGFVVLGLGVAVRYEQMFYIYAGVTLALGAYLTYGGFTMKGNPNAQGGR